jgi:hypothetical protein
MILIPQTYIIAIGLSLMGYFAITYPELCPKEYATKGETLIKYCKFDNNHKEWILKEGVKYEKNNKLE